MFDNNIENYSRELKALGIEHTIVEHPELKTPPEVQIYLGLTLSDGLSTMIMKADNGFVAIIRRDDYRIDSSKAKKELKIKKLRLATPEEFKELTHLPLGAARVYNPELPIFLDVKIFQKDILTGGSGSFTCSVRYKTEDLKKIPNSRIVDVSE